MTKYKDFAVEYKDGEKEDGGYIVAYASTFDREPDAYGDIVAKGAFLNSLAKHEAENNPIQFLFGHRTDDPMYNIGSVIEAKEDDYGLLIKAEFDPENEKAQYARKLVKEGRLKKLSFAYDVIDQATVELEDGTRANELRELDIYEVSLVPIPANQHAQVVEVKADDRDHGVDRSGKWESVRQEAFERDRKKNAKCAICGEPINYDRGLSTRGGDEYDPLAYEPSHIRSVREAPELELELSNIQASHAGCNRGDTHNGDRRDSNKDTTPEIKAGRVLSAKNQDDIEKAVALLNGVLSQLETAASNDSEEIPEDKKEGDPSTAEASEAGGKGTPVVDEDFLARFRKYTDQIKEK